MLQGIKEASKSRNANKKFVVLQVLEAAESGPKRVCPLMEPLGETFRKREAGLYSKDWIGGKLIRDSRTPKNPRIRESGKYALSQKLFDYLFGEEFPADPELRDEITELRKEIPTVPASTFEELRDLNFGSKWNERSALTNTRTAAVSSGGRQFPPVAPEENAWKK